MPDLPAGSVFDGLLIAEVIRTAVVPFHTGYRLPDGRIEPPYLITPKPSQMPESIKLALNSIGLELGPRLLLLVV